MDNTLLGCRSGPHSPPSISSLLLFYVLATRSSDGGAAATSRGARRSHIAGERCGGFIVPTDWLCNLSKGKVAPPLILGFYVARPELRDWHHKSIAMESDKPAKGYRTSQKSTRSSIALKKIVHELHHAPGLVGGIVEKGFSSSGNGNSSTGISPTIPLPRSTVLPFPVARHRSHGPVGTKKELTE